MEGKLIFLFVTIFLSFACAVKWNELQDYSFEKYLRGYKKIYTPQEYINRKALFDSNLEQVRNHNNDTNKSWKLGVNHMSDWTPEEFQRLLGYKKQLAFQTKHSQENVKVNFPTHAGKALPSHVDWREKGVVTAVKDQGQCGSCWAFGTAETIESHNALLTGKLWDFSEQQILDCTPNPQQCGGTGGCGGGTPELAYAQILKQGGLASEWTYPYISYDGTNFKCGFNINGTAQNIAVSLSGFTVLPSNQLTPVLTALANVGPLAINVDASAWSAYESGVFDGCNQVNPDIDHVVQLVGYGTDSTYGDYWLVRNSWSPGWGENGFIRLRRTSTLRCGIDKNPQDGTGCSNGPSQVTVCGTCAILYDVSYPNIAK